MVICASAVEARAALEAASRVMKELGVTINPQKTRIVHVRHGFEFLGYKIKRGSRPMNLPTSKIKTSARRGSLYAYPREKSINHFKEQIRRLTRRCAPVTTQELIQQVNPVVRGWGHHYKRALARRLRATGIAAGRSADVPCVTDDRERQWGGDGEEVGNACHGGFELSVPRGEWASKRADGISANL